MVCRQPPYRMRVGLAVRSLVGDKVVPPPEARTDTADRDKDKEDMLRNASDWDLKSPLVLPSSLPSWTVRLALFWAH